MLQAAQSIAQSVAELLEEELKEHPVRQADWRQTEHKAHKDTHAGSTGEAGR